MVKAWLWAHSGGRKFGSCKVKFSFCHVHINKLLNFLSLKGKPYISQKKKVCLCLGRD